MKHVVLFSGGATSSYMAYLLANDKEIPFKDLVFLHTPTLSECEDAEKFRLKVARKIGVPMTVWGRGEDIWDCIDRNRTIPNNFIPFCTRELKQQMKEEYFKYLKRCGEEWIEYIGYGPDEWRRVNKAKARNKAAGRCVKFPLFEKKISNDECKRKINDEWGIELPSAYKTLTHNNCIPCVKGGKAYFRRVWEHYPKEYQKLAEKEVKYGHTVFKGVSLKELADKFKADKEWKDMQLNLSSFIPCEGCIS